MWFFISNATCKYNFLKKLGAEMHENISNPDFELSAAIQRLGYHPDYVRRCFHEEFQTTPLQYITALRLNYAKTLLKRESFIGIEHVAEQCGFRDSFYFSTAFRKHFGFSPSAYRKVR